MSAPIRQRLRNRQGVFAVDHHGRRGPQTGGETLCGGGATLTPELLRASHIKPWAGSSDRERLDPFNGLLLAVHLDALFDRALMTFGDSGDAMVSDALSECDRAVFGLASALPKLLLSAAHLDYMRHHRERFAASRQTAPHL